MAGRTASHFRQNFRTGDKVTGVAYTGTGTNYATGTDRVATDFDGFLLTEKPSVSDPPIDGGLIPLNFNVPENYPKPYRKVTCIYVSLPGVTGIDILVVDPTTGAELVLPIQVIRAVPIDADKWVMQMTEREYGIPSGWGFKVVTDGADLTGDGFIYVATTVWELPARA